MSEQTNKAGYRQLTDAELETIAKIREQSERMKALIEKLEADPDIDKRCVALAKTHFQTGGMWLVRGITRPRFFF